jgi:hypothetical protein
MNLDLDHLDKTMSEYSILRKKILGRLCEVSEMLDFIRSNRTINGKVYNGWKGLTADSSMDSFITRSLSSYGYEFHAWTGILDISYHDSLASIVVEYLHESYDYSDRREVEQASITLPYYFFTDAASEAILAIRKNIAAVKREEIKEKKTVAALTKKAKELKELERLKAKYEKDSSA